MVSLDSYEVPKGTARELSHAGSKPIVFDDGEADLDGAALVVRGSRLAADEDPRILAGPRFACLGQEYWDLPEREFPSTVMRVLVAAGGTDRLELIGALSAAVRKGAPGTTITVALPTEPHRVPAAVDRVVVGREPIRDLLLDVDLAVLAAGQTLLEALAAGTPTVTLVIAANQRPGAEELERLGCIELVDGIAGVSDAVANLNRDSGRRMSLSRCGQEAVDGKGALRVASAATQLLGD